MKRIVGCEDFGDDRVGVEALGGAEVEAESGCRGVMSGSVDRRDCGAVASRADMFAWVGVVGVEGRAGVGGVGTGCAVAALLRVMPRPVRARICLNCSSLCSVESSRMLNVIRIPEAAQILLLATGWGLVPLLLFRSR